MFSGTKGYRTKPPAGVMLNPLHPLSQGLVGYWLFNEGAGSVAHDISGHGNHGILVNMATNAQGSGWGGSKFGGGLQFDGSDDYVDCGNNSSLKPPLPITISLWAKLNELSDFRWFFRNDDNLNYYGVWLAKTANNFQVSYLDGGVPGSANRRSKTGTTVLSTNTWYHVVVVINGATDMSIYVDGVDDGGAYSGTGGALTYSSSSASIGRSEYSGGARFFNGSIPLVSIWERALPQQQIKQLYEDPFCNLLRVPVRYAPAAPGGLSIPVAMNYYRRRRVA